MNALLDADLTHMVLNMHGVNKVDCAGLGSLAECCSQMRSRGLDLRLARVDRRLGELIRMFQLERALRKTSLQAMDRAVRLRCDLPSQPFGLHVPFVPWLEGIADITVEHGRTSMRHAGDIGETITHYEILEKVGEGGMGAVYRAHDSKLRRTVALKFLKPAHMDCSDSEIRFLEEARAAASLDHPNICPIHEIDRAEGLTFLAMAFVEGETLTEYLARKTPRLVEAIDIAEQVAEGLQAAHDSGIVHRDIKPGNIMIDRQGRVRITDFGLAQLSAEDDGAAMAVAGTPAYMSPEQFVGEPLDRQTDIWSLGVLLYEMVTGQLPFVAPPGLNLADVVRRCQPAPLSVLRRGVPKHLDWVAFRALAKKRSCRFQHVSEMAGALRHARNAIETELASPVPAEPRKCEDREPACKNCGLPAVEAEIRRKKRRGP